MIMNALYAVTRTDPKNTISTGAETDPFQKTKGFGFIYVQGITQELFIPCMVTPTTDWIKN